MQKKTKNNISRNNNNLKKKMQEDNKEHNFKYDKTHKKNLYGQPNLIC